MEIDAKTNYFVRSLIVLLCALIAVMIVYNFFILDPKGEINTGLITLILILVVIILSESFDRFSIGKIIAISRDNKRKETVITKLSSENDELRNQIINVATSVNQNQTSTNIFGLPEDVIKKFMVQRATEEEIQEKETEEKTTAEERVRPVERRPNFRQLEMMGINKFIEARNLDGSNLIRDAKLVTHFHGIDPVSNTPPIFDGYINTGEEEVFIQVRPATGHASIWRERIYMMLNKVYLYKSIKKVNAYMALVLVDIQTKEYTGRPNVAERLEEIFEPAIVNGVLRITKIALTEEESNSVMVERIRR